MPQSKARLIAGNFTTTGIPADVTGSTGSGSGGGVDSAEIIRIVDSAGGFDTGGGGVDSATTLDLVDFEKGVFRINSQTLDSDHTIDSADNAMSAGPVTVDSGVTLTVNGYWSVV
jgi:hypothetical protein